MNIGHCDDRKQSRSTPEIASFHGVTVTMRQAIVIIQQIRLEMERSPSSYF
ncbi:MAG: hypothetical protein F6K18_33065 [Okeania sp. SIO2C2]|uniref:hypothetical protein n=1 Tax=Okeania sp. SIO2C2 TaxID=2607787 RepID=UPI0013B62D09|nr:hypothetical protein [Okeania sp. SIO2C2]NEP91249.1 hypothetical protein [Okeania sp. SIO2C2]